jgi:DNA mismatch repair protein MutL
MPDIIRLLPDAVANQIAAGEVIQRPASVIKELVENAIDAGSTEIKINVKDAGKTFLQIVDNGCGMSDTDARLSFERHATSKIKEAQDLFAIQTMGFRGEALASIAAIAHVELKSRLHDQELGTHLVIEGSEVKKQESVNCPKGSNFLIKNLFYNVPARRKFLKTNSTELRHIIEEVQRVALSHADIHFLLIHNNVEIYNLPATNIKQRIVNILGKSSVQNLISINNKTTIASISGFIGKPEFAKKTAGDQFFFVNKRFMKHPYFYRAVLRAYENILPADTIPSFFIYFDVDPSNIDINIHPTKTEIKFENEQAMWQILTACVKEGLGKFNIVPSLDFENEMSIDIPVGQKDNNIEAPKIAINPNYNPFQESNRNVKKEELNSWENIFPKQNDFERISSNANPNELSGFEQTDITASKFLQVKNKYILLQVKSGLMIIDQQRAHQRILFEEMMLKLSEKKITTQRLIFPETLDLSPIETNVLKHLSKELKQLGFEIDNINENRFVINGVPGEFENVSIKILLDTLISDYKQNEQEISDKLNEWMVTIMSKFASVNYGKKLTQQEMNNIFDRLFACQIPNFTSDGKTIVSIINEEDFENLFN